MGSVPDLYTTGDNDPEIHPTSYYRHYLYCDACGSFQLDPWTEPEDLDKLATTRRRLGVAALLSSALVLVGGWDVLGLEPSPASLAWAALPVGLALLVGFLVWRAVLGSRIEYLGNRCRQCQATYAHGTPFFTDLDSNPRNLTIGDVPRPLGVSTFKIGKSVEHEPTPAPAWSRLPP